MKYRRGTLDHIISYIDSIPDKEFQQKCYDAIRKEHERFKRKDYTPEEQQMFDTAKKLAQGARRYIDKKLWLAFVMHEKYGKVWNDNEGR